MEEAAETAAAHRRIADARGDIVYIMQYARFDGRSEYEVGKESSSLQMLPDYG